MIPYRPEIDGLRALAVLPVILFHAGFSDFSGGFVGVDVFFVISGYLITSILLSEMQDGGFSLARFYERRARRILPALFVVVGVSAVAAYFFFLPSELKDFARSLVGVSLFASNITFWLESGYFDAAAETKPLLHTWSLAVEEQFYLLFPILLRAICRIGKQWVLGILVVLGITSLVLAQWAVYHRPGAAFYLLPTRGWELAMGAVSALASLSPPRQNAGLHVRQFMSLGGLGLIVLAIFAFDRHTPFPGFYALVPTVGAALIILFAAPSTLVGRLLGTRLMVGIGLISYSAYLWHQPMFAFARVTVDHPLTGIVSCGLVVGSLGLGYLSWKFVELPVRVNRTYFTSRAIFLGGVATAIVFFMAGTAAWSTNGFLNRWEGPDRYLAGLNRVDAGTFVQQRFNSLRGKSFDPVDGRKKILIVGDSYAQDLVNAVYEVGMDDRIQVVTRHINADCGNLFLPRKDFEHLIADEMKIFCSASALHEDPDFRALATAADEVWFASAWLPWQAELKHVSVENISRLTGRPARVFGTKGFGVVDVKGLLAMPREARRSVVQEIPKGIPVINGALEESLPDGVYIDIQSLMCGSNTSCLQMLDDGSLMSYDGGHLTRDGAKHLGERLLHEGIF